MPTPERLADYPLRGVPNVGPGTDQAAATGTIDIAAMARQGATLKSSTLAAGSGTGTLQVFITLAMPRESLQRLVEQSERAGATLVLRGLKAQSMRLTIAAAAELIGERRVSWVIDPNAFKRFNVRAAPTFVLTLAGDGVPVMPGIPTPSDPLGPGKVPGLPQCVGNGCTAPTSPADYLSVSGDVSLDYGLDVMLRHSPDAVPQASAILQRLRKP